jgi:hypothetical protein
VKRALTRIWIGVTLLFTPVALGAGTTLNPSEPTIHLTTERVLPGGVTQSEYLAEQFGWIRDF